MTEVIIVSQGQIIRNIEVQSGQRKDMVLLVYPGVSCDIRLDVKLPRGLKNEPVALKFNLKK